MVRIHSKRTIITSLIIGGVIGVLFYIISAQHKNIETLQNSNLLQKLQSFKIYSEQNNNIKYLESEVETLQQKNSINIAEYFDYIESLKSLDKKEYLLQYNEILNKYSSIFDKPETVYDCYTNEEIIYMWKCIETETFQCDFNSKVNVASVILNRIDSKNFPLDPIEIITSKNQFAYGRNNITEDTKIALEYAFMIEDTTNECIAFRSDISPTQWNGWDYQFTDDSGHHFYK